MIKAIRLALAAIAVGSVGFSAASAEASFQVVWNFSDLEGDQANEAATTGIGSGIVSGSLMTRNGGLLAAVGPSLTNQFASRNWGPPNTPTKFIEFSVSVSPGNTLDFSTMSFANQSSADGPADMAIHWSNDGINYALLDTFGAQTSEQTKTIGNALFSSEGLTGLSGTTSFRIFNTSDQSASAAGGADLELTSVRMACFHW